MRRPAGHRGSQEDLNADASYFALKNSVDAHGVIGLRAGVRERSALSGRLGGNWVHIGVNARFDHGEPAHGEYSQGWLRLRRSKHHRWSWMKRSLPVPPRRRPAYARPLVGGDGSPALDRRVRSSGLGKHDSASGSYSPHTPRSPASLHSVVMSPPSIVTSAPTTLAVSPLESSSTRSAISSGLWGARSRVWVADQR
jgi:hypothetical protein